MRRAGRALAAIALVAVAVSACGSDSETNSGAKSGATADPKLKSLQAKANLQPCPTPADEATGEKVLADVTLDCLGGGEAVPLRKLTGTPMVVNLWASWCPPCREETPDLARFAADADDRVEMLGIASGDSSPEAALSFLIAAKARYPSLYDEDADVQHDLGVPGLPATILVRPDGSVAKVLPKQVHYDELRDVVRSELGVSVP